MGAKQYFMAASHRDNAWTHGLVAELRRLGYDIWFDFDSLPPGGSFLEALQSQAQTRDFIFVVSPDSLASFWIQREITIALQAGRNLIPVLHVPTSLDGILANRQSIDATNAPPDVAARLVAKYLDRDDPAPVIRRMPGVRVFLSHATEDNGITKRVEQDLVKAGADVWVDYNEIAHGDFYRRINEGLSKSNWLVLVVTPSALRPDKDVIQEEVNAAKSMVRTQEMHGVIPFVVAPFDIRSMPPLWRNLERYDATEDYNAAFDKLAWALGLRERMFS